MAGNSVGYKIGEKTTPEGDVALVLYVEGSGSPVARASASASMLSDLQQLRGLDKPAVIEHLRKALLETLRSRGQLVEIADVKEDPGQPLRYSARFTHRWHDEITTGLVWYDVTTSETGPEAVPAIVRNKMRTEVHRTLTAPGSAARALVDLHQ